MSLPSGGATRLDVAAAAAVFAGVCAAWEAAARTGLVSPVFFPPPARILAALGLLAVDGRLWPHLGATLGRVAAGFALGGTSGLVVGLAIGRSPRLRTVVDPLIAAAHPVPKVALLPLAMLIFGLGETSRIALVAVSAFFPVALNTTAGVRFMNPVHLEVARNYGAAGLRLYRRVILPGSLPTILTGVRLALNVALLITVAIELVVAQRGLGRLVWLSWQTLRTEELYAALLTTAFVGLGFHLVVAGLGRRFTPWLPSV